MVLESLTTPVSAERKPLQMFFIGIVYSSVAILLSLWIFKDQASLVMVFLTVMACVPLIYHTIRLEEKKDKTPLTEKSLLKEHSRAIMFLTFLFVGFVISFAMWFTFLPTQLTQATFQTQIATINTINTQITSGTVISGEATNKITSNITSTTLFSRILLNNIKVLIFCLLFSFFYGSGAIFILTWNASVISAAVGTFIRNNLGAYAVQSGFLKIGAYFQIVSIGLLRYFIHGIPEIIAYFIGGLAGGIISVAVIKHDFGGENFHKIMYDALSLSLIALALLFVAALIEVWITPALF